MFFTAVCVPFHITLNIICVMSVRDWMKIKQNCFQLTYTCLPRGSIKGSAFQKTFCLCLISSLRSKRFRLVSEQKETVEGDFRF